MTLHQSKAKRTALAFCGTVAVGLGAAGIFLPLLPTTPFLLLAAACFFRSSDRLYNWLIHHKWFGHYIKQYREHKAISRQTKLATLLLLWVTLAFSALVVLDSVWARILLLAVGIGVTLHVLAMKTLKCSGRELSNADRERSDR
jgi:uncharacterized protein